MTALQEVVIAERPIREVDKEIREDPQLRGDISMAMSASFNGNDAERIALQEALVRDLGNATPSANEVKAGRANKKAESSVRSSIIRLFQGILKKVKRNGVERSVVDIGDKAKEAFITRLNELELPDRYMAELHPLITKITKPSFLIKIDALFGQETEFEQELMKLPDDVFGFLMDSVIKHTPVKNALQIQDVKIIDITKEYGRRKSNVSTTAAVERMQGISEFDKWRITFKGNFDMNNQAHQVVYTQVETALKSSDATAKKILNIPPGMTVLDWVNQKLAQVNIQQFTARSYGEVKGWAHTARNMIHGREHYDSQNGEFRGYHEITDIMLPYIEKGDEIYKEFITLVQQPDGSFRNQTNIKAFDKLRSDASKVVNILYRALHEAPTEKGEVFNSLREGSALLSAMRIISEWSDEHKIKEYIEHAYSDPNMNKVNVADELKRTFEGIANSILTNSEMHNFAANVNRIMSIGNLENLAHVNEEYRITKYKEKFLHNKYVAQGPHLLEAYSRSIINRNKMEVPHNFFATEIRKKNIDGEEITDLALQDPYFPTKEGFIHFAKKYFEAQKKPGDHEEIDELQLSETYIFANAFNAQTFRRAALFSQSKPYGTFNEMPDANVVAAINKKFSYTEKLGGLSQKGFWVRNAEVKSVPYQEMGTKWTEKGLPGLWFNGHDPRKIFQEAVMKQNKFRDHGKPIDFNNNLMSEKALANIYLKDNTIDPDQIVQKVSAGDFFQFGWRTEMFQSQYMDDRRVKEAADKKATANTPQPNEHYKAPKSWDENPEDFLLWCKTQGGTLVAYMAADKLAEKQATAYLKSVVAENKKWQDFSRNANLEMLRNNMMGIDDLYKAYTVSGALADKKLLPVFDIDENGKKVKRMITYNEYVFRIANGARGKVWADAAKVNTGQFLMNMEFLYDKLPEGYVMITHPDRLKDNKGNLIKLKLKASEFFLDPKYDAYDNATNVAADKDNDTKPGRLTIEDAKTRRDFRASLVKTKTDEKVPLAQLGRMMDFYYDLYEASAKTELPTDKLETRKATYENLAIAFGRARYGNINREDRSQAGAAELTKDHILSPEEKTKLENLKREHRAGTKLNHVQKEELARFSNAEILVDLMFKDGTSFMPYLKSMMGNTDEMEAAGLKMPSIPFNPKNPNSWPILSNINLYERSGLAWSRSQGQPTDPTLDFDVMAIANYGDRTGERGLARHASNIVALTKTQESLSKWYLAMVKGSLEKGDPFKAIYELTTEIKGVMTNTLDEGFAREICAELLQLTITDMLVDDTERKLPFFLGTIMRMVNADWDIQDMHNPHDFTSLARATRGPGAVLMRADDIDPFLEQCVKNGVINVEQKDRIKRKFKASTAMMIGWEVLPNGLFWFVLLNIWAALKEGVEELPGVGGPQK